MTCCPVHGCRPEAFERVEQDPLKQLSSSSFCWSAIVGEGGHIPEDISEPALCVEHHKLFAPKPNILVVHHDEVMLRYLRVLLQGKRYRVRTERDSLALAERIRNFTPALLLVESNMPVLSGIAIARSAFRSTKCGVLFLTTYPQDPTIRSGARELRSEGCNCRVFSAPFAIETMFRAARMVSPRM